MPLASPRARRTTLYVALLVLGAGLRLWGWPDLPAGLNQDEMSSGYEAWSLLQTGADRWGARWPAYFASWGSGQNVLYAYLTAPALGLFGLTSFSLRLVQAIAGIVTVAAVWPVAERSRRGAGPWATLIIAVCPWHVMLSRWGLESNLLPCLLVVGLLLLQRALQGGGAASVVVALLPFALALYAYGIVLVPLAVLLVLIAVRHRADIRARRAAWSAAAALFALVTAPFALFVLKAYIVKGPLPGEARLPFSLPTLNATRLDQVSGGFPLQQNIDFVFNGFDDQRIWNVVPGLQPLSPVLTVLAVVELTLICRTAWRARSLNAFGPVDLLLVAGASLLVLLPFGVNQGNTLALAIVLMAGKALARGLAAVTEHGLHRVLTATCAALVLVPGVTWFDDYAGPGYAAAAAENFNPGAADGLRRAAALDPMDPLFVTPSLALNYVQTLWHLGIAPMEFQQGGATFDDPDFGRYRFLQSDLGTLTNFSFVVRSWEPMPCAAPVGLVEADGLTSGRCVWTARYGLR